MRLRQRVARLARAGTRKSEVWWCFRNDDEQGEYVCGDRVLGAEEFERYASQLRDRQLVVWEFVYREGT